MSGNKCDVLANKWVQINCSGRFRNYCGWKDFGFFGIFEVGQSSNIHCLVWSVAFFLSVVSETWRHSLHIHVIFGSESALRKSIQLEKESIERLLRMEDTEESHKSGQMNIQMSCIVKSKLEELKTPYFLRTMYSRMVFASGPAGVRNRGPDHMVKLQNHCDQMPNSCTESRSITRLRDDDSLSKF